MAVMTSRLSWDPLERTNPAFIFKLEKADNDSCFYMQNLLSETWYWDTPAFYFCEFRDKTQRNPILFEKDDSTGLYKNPAGDTASGLHQEPRRVANTR